jgi:hypothetical protein
VPNGRREWRLYCQHRDLRWKDEGDKTLVNPGAKMVGKVHEALQGS